MKKTLVISALVLVPFFAAAACNSLPGGLPGGGTGGTSGDRDVVAAFLPDGVSLDVSEMPDPYGDATAKSKYAVSHDVLTPYQRALQAAGRIVYNFHRLADGALALGAHVRHDMTDPSQTQVSGNFTVNPTNPVQVSYRADFAAFKFINGDETLYGSGNAVDTPVAIRLWVDRGNGFERFMCALITAKPTQDSAGSRSTSGGNGNLGAGRLYTKPGAARPEAPADLQIYVEWDRTDAAHKWNDAFISGRLRDDLSLANGHERVDVRTEADNTLEKTVRSSTDFGDNPLGLQTLQASVHLKRESGAALISAQATGGGGTISINNQCVTLPDAMLDNTGKCSAFDLQDMTFIALPAGGETDFPADFPATPTF